MNKKIYQGFTLIELMIVVAIIGILAAVAIPAYREFVAISHGGAAMKGVNIYVSKGLACVQTGLGCTTLATEMTNDSKVSGSVAEETLSTIVFNDGVCIVSASINTDGLVIFSAATNDAVAASQVQCAQGAGL